MRPAPQEIPLDDGAKVRIDGASAEVLDPAGRLLVRYVDGSLEIAASSGDLTLSAPSGRVVVRSGEDIELDAPRVAVTAGVLVQTAERLEITATRLVEKTRDAFRDATDLAQTRAGRVRTLVRDVYALYARRTTIASTEETSIDGSKVLLG